MTLRYLGITKFYRQTHEAAITLLCLVDPFPTLRNAMLRGSFVRFPIEGMRCQSSLQEPEFLHINAVVEVEVALVIC